MRPSRGHAGRVRPRADVEAPPSGGPIVDVTPVAVLAVTAAGLLFLAERRWPLRRPVAALFARLGVNLLAAAFALAVAGGLVRPIVVRLLGAAAEEPTGLLGWLPLPAAAEMVLGFLLLDLSFYWWHRANHRIPFLWRFHNVHHLDPDLDVSTALRFHFGEIAFSAGFRIVQLTVLGVTAPVYWAYELCFQAGTLFHHSNVRLPVRFERTLARFLVTPRMHGIHHSQVEAEASSNYGVLLPLWDRLHRTLRLNVPQRLISIGVPGYSRAGDNELGAMLAHPFRRQRDHWAGPDGERPERGELPGRPVDLAE
jgi:sterol desaturase/sphingolipid hydroxylase (fatty acid hydroxylase superfamily)